MNGTLYIPAVACGLIGALGLAVNLAAHSRRTTVFWSTDIAPILQGHCATCHTKGGFGPMPLDS